jgi:glycolate oxidase FAD binding subunit
VPVLFEGSRGFVEAGTEAVGRLGTGATVDESPPGEWGRLPGTTTVKLAVEIGAVAAALEAVREIGGDDLVPVVRGSAGAGVLFVGIAPEPPPERIAEFIDRLRERAAGLGGSVVALRTPRGVKGLVDVWGPVAGLDLMRRVKQAFDPGRVLAPGRFVGGI